jgi:hypothetical protein
MENNNIIAGLEMVMKGLEDMKPKDVTPEEQKQIDNAIAKGSEQIDILKDAMKKAKKDIKL